MSRLYGVLILSAEAERQQAFYEKQLGLAMAPSPAGGATFPMRGAALLLRNVAAGGKPEVQLVVSVSPLDPKVETLKARGVAFEGDIESGPDGRHATLKDPEGNRVRLLEPATPVAESSWPRLSHAIVNVADLDKAGQFYRDVLGLRSLSERDGWHEFDTGATRLALHDRADTEGLPLHPDQRVTFALEDDDLEKWAEELRGRGVTFATNPMEEDLGVQAEVEDADGWFVVLHSPAPKDDLIDELDDEFADPETDGKRTQAIRKPGETSGEAAKKRTTPAKLARRTSERTITKAFEATRERETDRDRDRGSGGGFPARPSFGGAGPSRPSSPRPFTPRPSGPGGSSGSGQGGPSRPSSSGPSRPGSDRPSRSGPPRPGSGGPPRSGSGRDE